MVTTRVVTFVFIRVIHTPPSSAVASGRIWAVLVLARNGKSYGFAEALGVAYSILCWGVQTHRDVRECIPVN